jgi:hypothetical protein
MSNLPKPAPLGRITAKRDEEKIGHSHGKRDTPPKVIPAFEDIEYTRPEPEPSWREPVKRWYNSVELSAYSQLYQPSDWETVWILADYMNNLKTSSAHALAALMNAMSDLMITEGARRRAKVEIQRLGVDDFEEERQARVLDIKDRLNGVRRAAV